MEGHSEEADIMSRFRGAAVLEDGAERAAIPANAARRRSPESPPIGIDLSGRAKLWFVMGAGGAGKTVLARWLFWRMIGQGRHAALAAVGPEEGSLTSWFAGVERPLASDGAEMARWLREYLDYLMSGARRRGRSAILDFGGDITALERVVRAAPDLHRTLGNAGFGVVACYVLTPWRDDLNAARTMKSAGFQPEATVLLLNEGRAESPTPPEVAFARATRHDGFRDAVARGAIVARMPVLDGDVMREIERQRLDFGAARDGRRAGGATFQPMGSLGRDMVGRWLERMEAAFAPIGTWLP